MIDEVGIRDDESEEDRRRVRVRRVAMVAVVALAAGGVALVAALVPRDSSAGSQPPAPRRSPGEWVEVSPDARTNAVSEQGVAVLDVAFQPGDDGIDPLAAQLHFQHDGSVLAVDRRASVVTLFALDGGTRWSVGVPRTVGGGTLFTGALGPDDIVYLVYDRVTATDVFVAVPATGSHAGTVVARWETPWGPGGCAVCRIPIFEETGVVAALDADDAPVVVPFVGDDGKPSGATIEPDPQMGNGEQETADPSVVRLMYYTYTGGPTPMPSSPEWDLEVPGLVRDPDPIPTIRPLPDGGVAGVVRNAPDTAHPFGAQTLFVGRLDGSVELYGLTTTTSYGDVFEVDGQLYALEAHADAGNFTLVRLDPMSASVGDD